MSIFEDCGLSPDATIEQIADKMLYEARAFCDSGFSELRLLIENLIEAIESRAREAGRINGIDQAISIAQDFGTRYPTDVFIEPTIEQWAEIHLNNQKNFSDVISASMGRHCARVIAKEIMAMKENQEEQP